MSKKLVLLLVGILLCNIFVATNGSASGPLDKIKEKFELKSELILTVDEEFTEHGTLIMPGTRQNITVNVKYRLDVKPIISNFFIGTKIGNFLFVTAFPLNIPNLIHPHNPYFLDPTVYLGIYPSIHWFVLCFHGLRVPFLIVHSVMVPFHLHSLQQDLR